jgi:hypothetical protein
VGVVETVVGVGEEDVEGVSDFTSKPSFVGSGSRLVVMAARSIQRLFSQGCLSAHDLPATRYHGCSRRPHMAQTCSLEGIYFCLATFTR